MRGKHHDHCIARNAGTGACTKRAKGRRFCSRHAGQFRLGIIDERGKKLRDPTWNRDARNLFAACLAKGKPGCTPCQGKRRGRFCGKHWNHHYHMIIDRDGYVIRKVGPTHGGRAPTYTGCVAANKGAGPCRGNRCGRFCNRHAGQYYLGIIDKNGNKLRKLAQEVVCGIPGCNRHAGFKSGLCQHHYKEIVVFHHFHDYESLSKMPKGKEMSEYEEVWSDAPSARR